MDRNGLDKHEGHMSTVKPGVKEHMEKTIQWFKIIGGFKPCLVLQLAETTNSWCHKHMKQQHAKHCVKTPKDLAFDEGGCG